MPRFTLRVNKQPIPESRGEPRSRHRTVIVRLAPQETHDGPLATPFGVFPYREAGERAAHRHLGDRGRQDQDVDCYPEGTIIFSQLGVLANLQAALMPVGGAQDNDRA